VSKFVKTLSVVAVAGALALVASSTAEAQGRRGGPRGGRTRVVVAGGYPSPYFYGGWGYPFFTGWYGYPYGYPYPPYYGYGPYARDGSLRLQVEPRQAEVFVDGYYAGVVDDFDGTFQRLRVEPGEHDVQVYLAGYHGLHQQVYVQVDKTFTIKQTLQALAPGDQPEERPIPRTPPEDPRNAPGGRDPRMPPPGPRRSGPLADRGQGDGASLALRVQPADAEILIDGEPWQGSAGGNRLVIQLAPGDHRIEVRKQGYVSYMSSVRVRPGDATPINISLTRE
jgi:PEGA domain